MINVQIDSWGIPAEIWETLNWEIFSTNWPLAQPTKPEKAYSVEGGPCRLSDGEATALSLLGISLKIVPLPGMMITKMADRAKWDHDVNPQAIRDASAVQIAVPDMGLLLIDEVEVLEDCCTHALQGYLDDGWRILAICPPNAARRPDYIIGRRRVK